jgi:hypothetical protein
MSTEVLAGVISSHLRFRKSPLEIVDEPLRIYDSTGVPLFLLA